MEEGIFKKAEVLVEAYPYIKKYQGAIFVIKAGGSMLRMPEARKHILTDIAFLEMVGIKTLLVCGGGPFITEEIEKRGKKPVFIEGLRVTNTDTLEIVKEILYGVRDGIVRDIKRYLGAAAGVLLPEEKFMTARKIHYQRGEEIVDLGYVGQVENVNEDYIKQKFAETGILVIAPLGYSKTGEMLNINGDAVASSLAKGLKAEKLIFLTDVMGVMRNPENPETLLSVLQFSQVKELIDKDIIKEGMIPKVKSAVAAMEKGVDKAHIISGNVHHSILLEIFTKHGVGTEIVKNE
jgi:acetylglutamate kinase